MYTVYYNQLGRTQAYYQNIAHKYLEKVVQVNVDYSSLEERILAQHGEVIVYPADPQKLKEFYGMFYGVGVPNQGTQRRVLKKVRRNVISGKTQDDMVQDCGHARGVQQFNTRCLGTSTGQALRIIGDAMCNPATEIRITNIDHAISDGTVRAGRGVLNQNFRSIVAKHIGNMKGFTFTDTHIVFNPIVTEETYVEI
jgi:hypothetical protein